MAHPLFGHSVAEAGGEAPNLSCSTTLPSLMDRHIIFFTVFSPALLFPLFFTIHVCFLNTPFCLLFILYVSSPPSVVKPLSDGQMLTLKEVRKNCLKPGCWQNTNVFDQSRVRCPVCPLSYIPFSLSLTLSPILFPSVFLCVCVHVPTHDGSR